MPRQWLGATTNSKWRWGGREEGAGREERAVGGGGSVWLEWGKGVNMSWDEGDVLSEDKFPTRFEQCWDRVSTRLSVYD